VYDWNEGLDASIATEIGPMLATAVSSAVSSPAGVMSLEPAHVAPTVAGLNRHAPSYHINTNVHQMQDGTHNNGLYR